MNYAVLHATRAAWSNATPDLKNDYGFSTQLVSAMNACFLSFYAAGGIVSGHLADMFNKKWFLLITYSLVGLINIFIGCQ
jgi:sugar phosphate permease